MLALHCSAHHHTQTAHRESEISCWAKHDWSSKFHLNTKNEVTRFALLRQQAEEEKEEEDERPQAAACRLHCSRRGQRRGRGHMLRLFGGLKRGPGRPRAAAAPVRPLLLHASTSTPPPPTLPPPPNPTPTPTPKPNWRRRPQVCSAPSAAP